MRVSSSVNPGSDYKGGLGCKTKCYRHVYCWVFWDNYIQQLLKGKDGIVMKRSLYRVINNLRANYWALIICITISTLVIIFSLLNCSLEVFFRAWVGAWVWAHYKTYSIEFKHLACGVLLLTCECDVALNLYHSYIPFHYSSRSQ